MNENEPLLAPKNIGDNSISDNFDDKNTIGDQFNDGNTIGEKFNDENTIGVKFNDENTIGDKFPDENTIGEKFNDDKSKVELSILQISEFGRCKDEPTLLPEKSAKEEKENNFTGYLVNIFTS